MFNNSKSKDKDDLAIYVEIGLHRLYFDYDKTTKFIEKVRCQVSWINPATGQYGQ